MSCLPLLYGSRRQSFVACTHRLCVGVCAHDKVTLAIVVGHWTSGTNLAAQPGTHSAQAGQSRVTSGAVPEALQVDVLRTASQSSTCCGQHTQQDRVWDHRCQDKHACCTCVVSTLLSWSPPIRLCEWIPGLAPSQALAMLALTSYSESGRMTSGAWAA